MLRSLQTIHHRNQPKFGELTPQQRTLFFKSPALSMLEPERLLKILAINAHQYKNQDNYSQTEYLTYKALLEQELLKRLDEPPKDSFSPGGLNPNKPEQVKAAQLLAELAALPIYTPTSEFFNTLIERIEGKKPAQ